jgi:PAS domain S-box-containing protein
VRVRVRAVPAHRSPRPYFLVVFDEPVPAAPVPPADALVRHLVEELRAAREDLGATAARSQTAGEDMRAANEEMVSVNEELQSAVEELETSKEELQSLNEELTTTNAQLREQGEALAVATADITNLLNSTDLAAVFVCPAGNVRRFTPAATRLFRLIPADVGRPLADLAHAVLDPTIHADIRAVAGGADPPPDREVAGADDRWFLRRALPYRTADGRTDGVILTFADVTPLKRAEVALRRNQELLRLAAVLTDSSDAVLLVEADGRLSAWSRGAERLYGYPEGEGVGLAMADLIPDADRAADLAALDAVRRGEAVGSWETRRRDRAGRVLDVSVTATLLRPADGAAPAVSLTERDLTAHKQLERELRERSDRTAAILEAVADPIITSTESGVIESVNRATERAFGCPAADLVGRDFGTLLAPDTRGPDDPSVATLLDARAVQAGRGECEIVCVRRDGTTFAADLTVGRVDHLARFVAVVRDTTERRRLEREVLEIAAAEQERIGRELHDSVGQELTGIRLMTEALTSGLRDHGSEELGLAVRVSDGLRDALARVRALSRGLVAAEVDAAGLGPALSALAGRVRETTVVGCTFEASGTARLSDAAASHLLRIAQEAVANALRHAGATRVWIALAASEAATELRVGDDGRGFTTAAAASAGGLGLKLMRYRAGRIGAAFRVDTGPAGTVVACSLTAGASDGR